MDSKIVMLRRVGTKRYVWAIGHTMQDLERQLSEMTGVWNGFYPCSLWSMQKEPDFDYYDACSIPAHVEPTDEAIHEYGKFIHHYVAVVSTGLCDAA